MYAAVSSQNSVFQGWHRVGSAFVTAGSWWPQSLSQTPLAEHSPFQNVPGGQAALRACWEGRGVAGAPAHKFGLGVPRALCIPQPLVEALVISVLSSAHRDLTENFHIKKGRKKRQHCQKETTKASRRLSSYLQFALK